MLREKFPRFMIAFAISISISMSVSHTVGSGYSIPYLTALATVFILFYHVVMLNKISISVTLSATGLSILAVILSPSLREKFFQFVSEIPVFLKWIQAYSSGAARFNEVYVNCLVISVIAVTVLFTYVFTVKRFSFVVILAGGMTFFIVQWIYGYLLENIYFYIFITALLVSYFLHIHNRLTFSYKNEFSGSSSVFGLAVPVALIILVISIAMPYDNSPIKWDWMDRKFNKLMDYWNELPVNHTEFDYFSVGSTGFGTDNGLLGGKVTLDDTHVLTIESSYHVYLKGAASSIYNDNRWQDNNVYHETGSNIQDIITWDSYEFEKGMELLSEGSTNERDFWEDKRITVTFEKLRTKSLFTPPKLSSMELKENSIGLLYSPNDTISSEEMLSMGFGYEAEYKHIDYNNPLLKELLNKSRKNFYKDFLLKKYGLNLRLKYNKMLDGFLFQEKSWENSDSLYPDGNHETESEPVMLMHLAYMAQLNYSRYLQIPEGFPSRIGKLTATITDEYESGYEKARAIEFFLTNNFEYTLEPASLPAGRDFVDFFLFDSKEGYCTYFATSMVMMLRTIGIPARYVEGYILPSEPDSEDSNIYSVTNRQAHAWVEAYFEGAGWIPFEPTSPFTSGFYRSNLVNPSYSSSLYDDPYYMDYMHELEMYNMFPEDSIAIENPDESKIAPYLIVLFVIIAAFTIVVFIILYNIARFQFKLFRIKRMAPGKAVIKLFGNCFTLLGLIGYPIKPGETASEYARRLEKYIVLPQEYENRHDSIIKISNPGKDIVSPIQIVFDIFIRARYSRNVISVQEKNKVLDYFHILLSKARDEEKMKFFISRFILGRV